MRLKYFFLLLYCVLSFQAQAQNKAQLLAAKKAKQAKLNEVSKILNETSRKHNTSMGQLNALQAQINTRQEIVNSTQKELAMINDDMEETNIIIGALESDLISLKKEYGKMIFEASKISNTYNRLSFIFSSSSFNDAYKRVAYLRQYTKARQIQVEQIKKTQTELEKQNKKIFSQKKIKSDAIKNFSKEKDALKNLIAEKNKLVKKLSSKVSQLRVQYNKEKIALKSLEKNLLASINKNIKKSSKRSKTISTPAAKVISKSFSANKNRLIWPVNSGFISKKFGKRKHPIHNIRENNIGVNIQTKKGASVRAVFKGTVVLLHERPGFGYTVMINHGQYYTVYNNLKSISIKKGQKVNQKTILGRVMTNTSGITELLFCISFNNKFQNPESWLIKK